LPSHEQAWSCLVFRVRPGAVDEYVRRHRDMPESVVAAFRECGVLESEIFIRGDVVVSVSAFGRDPLSVQERLEDHPEINSWIASFRDLVEERGLEDGEEEATAASVWRLPSVNHGHDRF
jgi:L-rhamnose mutarotase